MIELNRRRVLQLLQYALGIAGLAWVVVQADWIRTTQLLIQIPAATGLGIIGITIAGLLFRFHMWHVLIDEFQEIPRLTSSKIDLVVNFINHLLPSRLTGRGAAPYVIRQHTGLAWAETVAIAAIHTGVYAILYGIIALIGLWLGYLRLSPAIVTLILFSTLLYLVAGTVVLISGSNLRLVGGFVEWFDRYTQALPVIGNRLDGVLQAIPTITEDSEKSFNRMLRQPRLNLSFAIGWVGALLLAPGVRVWLLAEVLGGGMDFGLALPFFLVAAYSVTVLPITPGGVGVTEATATLFFTALGVPVEIIAPVIFFDRFIGVYLPALAGWYPAVQMNVVEVPE